MGVDGRVRDQLSATTRFGDIRHFDQIDSTNGWLRRQAELGAPEGLVAVTDYQRAGRGRRGRLWEAPAGSALLVSILLRPGDLPAERWHLLTAASSLALRAGCVGIGGFRPELKWPNDLVVADRKLAGILAESIPGAVVMGIGCNLTWAPPGATTAAEAAGRAVSRDALLGATLGHLEHLLGGWDAVADAYQQACCTLGRRVRVEGDHGWVEGVAEAVDGAGRIVVRPDGADPVTFSAGDVIHLGGAGPG